MNMKVPCATAVALLCAACGTSSNASQPPGGGGSSNGPMSYRGVAISGGGAGIPTGSGGATTPATSGGAAGAPVLPPSSGGQIVAAGGRPASGGIPGNGGAGNGGAPNPGNGGAPSGGAAGAAGSGASSGSDVCTRWKADRANLSEGTWSGDVASCSAGDITPDARATALRLVNLYRWLGGLPAVMDDPAMDAKDQQCALMMRANGMLSHMPPNTWKCWTQDGANAANGSNIGTAPPIASIDGYMLDPGNPTTIGHRRWMLSNQLGPIGIGGTDRTSCVMTLGGTGKAGKQWAAWPPPGAVPIQALGGGFQGTVDTTGWTIQSDTVNLSAAQVAVTSAGAMLATTVTQLGSGYGSRYALRFNPMGWTTQAGKHYQVSVSGVTPAISYEFDVLDCK